MGSAALLLVLQLGVSQFVISTKAGLVNLVQGEANVKPRQQLRVGEPVRTGDGSAAEILLNPGSYLRVGADSEVVLDKVELVSVAVRIVSGSAIIEAAGFEEGAPLTVRLGELEAKIIADGIYKFENGKITILDGKLQLAGDKNTYKKGWQVSTAGPAKIIKKIPTDLEVWSRRRSELLASANTSVASTLRSTSPSLASSLYDVWLWVPGFGGYTFMPGFRYQNPYGFAYRTVTEIYNLRPTGAGNASNNNGGGGGFPTASNNNPGSNNTNTGSGGGGAGASAPPPAPRQIDLDRVPSAVRNKLDP
jgi:hypothetical protein